MSSFESLKQPILSEYVLGTNLNSLKRLKEENIIYRKSPNWWSTDYASDPRKLVSFEEFQEKLISLSSSKTDMISPRLYPDPQVPISILNLEIDNQEFKFIVTCRPYHEKEKHSDFSSQRLFSNDLDSGNSIEDIKKKWRNNKKVKLQDHFYPHIRGLFVSKRDNHFFWYPLVTENEYNSSGKRMEDKILTNKKIKDALIKKNLSFINIYDSYGLEITYNGILDELQDKSGQPYFSFKKLNKINNINFDANEISAEEFIDNYHNNLQNSSDFYVKYPLKLPIFSSTLTLIIFNKTSEDNLNRNPVILGILADDDCSGRYDHKGILRIKDKSLAQEISKKISADFGFHVDTILFTPQVGHPKYDRISLDNL